ENANDDDRQHDEADHLVHGDLVLADVSRFRLRHAVEGDVTNLRDAPDQAQYAGFESTAIVALFEGRHHELTARLARVPVGDDLFEVVADLDPDAPLLEREQDENAVVLALVADPAPAVLEHLHRVVADVRLGLVA